ncbi:MAG: ATPase [Myxococcales bacterium]
MLPSPLVRSLATRLRVPYPLIALVSHEEHRSIEVVRAAAALAGLPVRVVACRDAGDLLGALPPPADLGAGVTLLLDPHPWLEEPRVVRTLRDLLPGLAAAGHVIVLAGPVAVVPPALEKDLVVLELPLPGEEELAAVCERVLVERGISGSPLVSLAARAAKGLTGDEAARAFGRVALETGFVGDGVIPGIASEKQALLRRSELLDLVDEAPGLGDVGGLDELKRWLVGRQEAFGDRARAFGLPQPRGLLLLGVQGCGKSLTAKATARVWGLPLARLDLSQLFARGRSPEDNLRRVQRLAEALAPLVLWIDEIDKSFAGVGSGGGEALNRVFASFITWLQEKREPVFVVATANGIADLPPELLRKGRFDEIFFVDLPSKREREAILRIHLMRRGRDPGGFDLATLADRTEHFAGAELEQVVVSGLYDAFGEDRELDTADLLRAASETTPLYDTYEEAIKELRSWAARRARMASGDTRLVELFRG